MRVIDTYSGDSCAEEPTPFLYVLCCAAAIVCCSRCACRLRGFRRTVHYFQATVRGHPFGSERLGLMQSYHVPLCDVLVGRAPHDSFGARRLATRWSWHQQRHRRLHHPHLPQGRIAPLLHSFVSFRSSLLCCLLDSRGTQIMRAFYSLGFELTLGRLKIQLYRRY